MLMGLEPARLRGWVTGKSVWLYELILIRSDIYSDHLNVCVCVCVTCSSCSSKGSTLSRRGCKKTSETSGKGDESGRGLETQVPLEDLERNQKILQWMMEGDRQRKSSHG